MTPTTTALARIMPSTQRVYAYKQRVFAAWCRASGHSASAADFDVLLAFLRWGAQRWRRSTMSVTLSAIAHQRRRSGLEVDTRLLHFFLRGLQSGRTVVGTAAAALDADTLRTSLELLPESLEGLRDRALLWLGFTAALRPGELVGLQLSRPSSAASGTIAIGRDGIRIVLSGRKFAQRGTQSIKHVPRTSEPCAVAATERWLAGAGITEGPVFRSLTRSGRLASSRLRPAAVTRILRRRVGEAWQAQGLTQQDICRRLQSIKGYSLRSGFVTAAVASNVDGQLLARHLGWSNPHMAVRYNRPGRDGDILLVEQVLSHMERAQNAD